MAGKFPLTRGRGRAKPLRAVRLLFRRLPTHPDPGYAPRMIRTLSLLLFLVAAPVLAAEPTTITGRVVSLADGDTLTVLDAGKTQHKIRLHGIDTPEKKQAYGTKAREALGALVFQKDVSVTVVDKDRYGRLVGKVKQGDTDVNRELVAKGYAWRYSQFDKKGEYTAVQAEAKAAKRGLWADPDPVPPWEFRRKK